MKVIDGADDGALGGPPKPPQSVPSPKARYSVAKGKSVVAAGGIINQLQEITAKDLVQTDKDVSRGQESLDQLVAKGYVDKNF